MRGDSKNQVRLAGAWPSGQQVSSPIRDSQIHIDPLRVHVGLNVSDQIPDEPCSPSWFSFLHNLRLRLVHRASALSVSLRDYHCFVARSNLKMDPESSFRSCKQRTILTGACEQCHSLKQNTWIVAACHSCKMLKPSQGSVSDLIIGRALN